jgi:hypothetical protein
MFIPFQTSNINYRKNFKYHVDNRIKNRKIRKDPDTEGEINDIWHLIKLKRHLRIFLTSKLMKISNYKDFQKAIMNRAIIVQTQAMIKFVTKKHLIPPDLSKCTNGRMFLMSVLISKFPEEVMPDPSMEEIKLISSASHVFTSFKSLVRMKSSRNESDFVIRWIEYVQEFTKWEKDSKTQLIDDLKNDYKVMEDMSRSLVGDARDEWLPHINKHQGRLEVALRRYEPLVLQL